MGWDECVPYARYGESLESVTAQIEALPTDITLRRVAGRAGTRCRTQCRRLRAVGSGGEGRRQQVWDLAGLSAPGPVTTAYTLSLDTPERMQMKAAENAHRPLLKIKLGTPDDMGRLEAVRRGAPEATIIVDPTNEGWRSRPISTSRRI